MKKDNHIFKVIVIGDSGVGKTTLCYRLEYGTFKEDTRKTIGVQFVIKRLQAVGKEINSNIDLQIWDFSGENRFRMLLPMYLRGTSGGVFVYDITNRASFERMDDWIKFVRTENGKDFPIIICGSKKDLEVVRTVSKEEAIEKSRMYSDGKVFEFSSKDNLNIYEIFKELTKKLLELDCEIYFTENNK